MTARETKFLLSLLMALLCPAARGQQSSGPSPALQVSRLRNQITFISPNVACHQGYATDGTNHYTFDDQAIYKWDYANWTLVASNTAVFQGVPTLTHLGDGDVYNGKIYEVAEIWLGCGAGGGSNQSLVTFDATTLKLLGIHNVVADGHEVSGLAVVPSDGPNGTIYVTSYCDGSKIWKYDLSTFALLGTLPLSRNILSIQGIAWANGKFYIAQDPAQNSGFIYEFDYSGNVSQVYATSITGYHEGLKFVQGQIRWLIDGGTGHKCVYYISLDSMVVSFPASAAGWILESSGGLGQPWLPVATGAAAASAAGFSITLPTPSNNTFFHLRHP